MPLIFLSYRRTDSPQACRVHDWLARRFGEHGVFMDVSDIPFAVAFPDFLRDSIERSGTLIALIGPTWQERIAEPDDAVRMEIETALSHNIPVLPILIGTTPMPDPDSLPESVRSIAHQNAHAVGVSRDFEAHMEMLMPRIEGILAAMANERSAAMDADVIDRVSRGIITHLDRLASQKGGESVRDVRWRVVNAAELELVGGTAVTLFVHQVKQLADLLELHFILSFWGDSQRDEYQLAGWALTNLAQTPILPSDAFALGNQEPLWEVRVRSSDEDARAVWRLITTSPLRLSLSYVAVVSPARQPS